MMEVLMQQAAVANKQKLDCEDELDALRAARFSAERVLPQQAAEVKSEVEKQLRQERVEFDRQKDEYERMISELQAECSQLKVQAEKQHRPTFEIVSNKSSAVPLEPVSIPCPSNTSAQNIWACPRCTYHNSSSANRCKICDLPRSSNRTLQC